MFIYSQLLNVQLFDMLFVTLWGTVLMVGATVNV